MSKLSIRTEITDEYADLQDKIVEIKMRVSDMDEYKGDEEVTNMTGEEFVKLCYEEKEDVLKEYFAQSTCTEVGEKIRLLWRCIRRKSFDRKGTEI